MFFNSIILVIGFVLLIRGADVFVEGASKVAAKFAIPEIVIGLTIVAFGTSAPEAAISIVSSYKGSAGLSIGNIIGSNICNVLLILGVSGVISTLHIEKNTLHVEIPFVIIITLLLTALGTMGLSVSRLDGVILWLFFIAFLTYLYWLSKNGEQTGIDDVPQLKENDTLIKLVIMIVLGIAAIVIGSDMVVDGATAIAEAFGVSNRIIGLTIVALGTSLPELVTCVSASLKGKNDLVVGNIIGSDVFNVLFVLGTSALVSPVAIPFSLDFILDIIIAIGALVLFVIGIDKQRNLRKIGAYVMLGCYFIYIISLM